MAGYWRYPQILDKGNELATDEHSRLFCRRLIDCEKSVKILGPGANVIQILYYV